MLELGLPLGEVVVPLGEVVKPLGEVVVPLGERVLPPREEVVPLGEVVVPLGKVVVPIGVVVVPLGVVPAPLSVGLVTGGEGPKPIEKAGVLPAGLDVPLGEVPVPFSVAVVPPGEGLMPSGGEEVADGGPAWSPAKAPELAREMDVPLEEVDKSLCEVGTGGGELGAALKGAGDEVGVALEGVEAVGVAVKGVGNREVGVALEGIGVGREERLGLLLVTVLSAGAVEGLFATDGAPPTALGGDATGGSRSGCAGDDVPPAVPLEAGLLPALEVPGVSVPVPGVPAAVPGVPAPVPGVPRAVPRVAGVVAVMAAGDAPEDCPWDAAYLAADADAVVAAASADPAPKGTV